MAVYDSESNVLRLTIAAPFGSGEMVGAVWAHLREALAAQPVNSSAVPASSATTLQRIKTVNFAVDRVRFIMGNMSLQLASPSDRRQQDSTRYATIGHPWAVVAELPKLPALATKRRSEAKEK